MQICQPYCISAHLSEMQRSTLVSNWKMDIWQSTASWICDLVPCPKLQVCATGDSGSRE